MVPCGSCSGAVARLQVGACPRELTRDEIPFYIEVMAKPQTGRFDAAGYYAFDLSSGEVRTRAGRRMLILDCDAMGPLISTAVKHGDLTAVRLLGHKIGDQIKGACDGGAGDMSPDEVMANASAVIGLLGFGRLSLEAWGPAVVLRLQGAPDMDQERLGLAALLGGMLASVVGQDCGCVPVGSDGHFVVVDPTVAGQVWSWSQEGQPLASVIGRIVSGEAA
jgi:hypothetical protein